MRTKKEIKEIREILKANQEFDPQLWRTVLIQMLGWVLDDPQQMEIKLNDL